MSLPPPRGPPPGAPMGAAPISRDTIAALKNKKIKISRSEVEENDDSFQLNKSQDLSVSLGFDDDDDDDDDRSEENSYEDARYKDDSYGDGGNDYYDDDRSQRDNRYENEDEGYLDEDVEDRDRYSYLDEISSTAVNEAQPKARPSGAGNYNSSSSLKEKVGNYKSPYIFEEGSRLPYLPGTPEIFDFKPILRATYRELRNFVLSPCEPGKVVRCYIERNRNGTNALAPTYSLCADLEDGTGRELIVCRKIFFSSDSHLVFSLKGEDLYRKREQRSRLYLGKLRSEASNRKYVLYDNGNVAINDSESKSSYKKEKDIYESSSNADYPGEFFPGIDDSIMAAEEKGSVDKKSSDKKSGSRDDAASLYRKELCIVFNNTTKRPAPTGVRGTEVCIPSTYLNCNTQAYYVSRSKMTTSEQQAIKDKNGGLFGATASPKRNGGGAIHQLVPPISSKSMQSNFSKVRAAGKQNAKYCQDLFLMHERTSKYDPLSACLVDFKGRANVPSVKNCQFVESGPQDAEAKDADQNKPVLIQMGKTTEDCFNVDVRYPVSLLQAFAVCVTRLDSSMSWA